jgi:hypothetical protein
VADVPVGAAELLELQRDLERALRADPRRPGAASAIFALGKRDDPGLRGVLADCLRSHLDGDPEALYQALIALENQWETIPWETDVQSIHNAAANRRVAAAYLGRAAGRTS